MLSNLAEMWWNRVLFWIIYVIVLIYYLRLRCEILFHLFSTGGNDGRLLSPELKHLFLNTEPVSSSSNNDM